MPLVIFKAPNCLHCAIHLLVQGMIEDGAVNAERALSDVAEVLADLIAVGFKPVDRDQVMEHILAYVKEAEVETRKMVKKGL